MNYEKLLQLKASGFNLTGNSLLWKFPDESEKLRLNLSDKVVFENQSGIYVPSLSELIEACGELQLITKKRDAKCNGELVDTFTYEAYTEEPRVLSFIGSTPEEAVANLWLALHTKS